MPAIVRAIDVGFGQTKYVSAVDGDAVECAHFPSIALPSMVDPGARTIPGGRRRTVSIPIASMYYEVGPEIDLVGAHTRPPLSIEGYVETHEYLALLRGALSMMKVDSIDLLVVGLPVSTFARRKALLERRATGEHDVGNGRVVKVARAIAIAQPQGALVTYALQHETLEAIRRQENLVIDAGSRTFDWLSAHGLRLVSNRSGSAASSATRTRSSDTSRSSTPWRRRRCERCCSRSAANIDSTTSCSSAAVRTYSGRRCERRSQGKRSRRSPSRSTRTFVASSGRAWTSHEDEADEVSARKRGRVTVTVDFDQASNPELYEEVMKVKRGKQRAQRIRSMMLKGYMVELGPGLRGQGVPRTAAALPTSTSGAEDVFGAPLEG